MGNEGAYAYHVGMKMLQKEHVLCQVPRLLKRRTNHKPGSCLEADGLQVKEAGLPVGGAHLRRVELCVVAGIEGLVAQKIPVCPGIKEGW